MQVGEREKEKYLPWHYKSTIRLQVKWKEKLPRVIYRLYALYLYTPQTP